jgi:hypothetical protein
MFLKRVSKSNPLFLYVIFTNLKNYNIMDLFNKKKLAALREQLDFTSASLEVMSKDMTTLQKSVFRLYEEITTYFKPRYINKYYKWKICDMVHYIKCVDVEFKGGNFEFKVIYTGQTKVKRIFLSFENLKMLTVTTKKEYIENGGNK